MSHVSPFRGGAVLAKAADGRIGRCGNVLRENTQSKSKMMQAG
jgi:hypothetical protein